MTAWATLEQARTFWADAAALPDATLGVLLDVATEQCREYAPSLPDPQPPRHMLACVYQARELRSAALRGEADIVGVGDYALRSRPLTGPVKSLLRPIGARPRFGPPPATP